MTSNKNFLIQNLGVLSSAVTSDHPTHDSPMRPFSVDVPVNSNRGFEMFIPGPSTLCRVDEIDILNQVVQAMEDSGQGGIICDALHILEDELLGIPCIAIYADSKKLPAYTRGVWANIAEFVDKRTAGNVRTLLIVPAYYNGTAVKDIDLSTLPSLASKATAINVRVENGMYISYMHRPPSMI